MGNNIAPRWGGTKEVTNHECSRGPQVWDPWDVVSWKCLRTYHTGSKTLHTLPTPWSTKKWVKSIDPTVQMLTSFSTLFCISCFVRFFVWYFRVIERLRTSNLWWVQILQHPKIGHQHKCYVYLRKDLQFCHIIAPTSNAPELMGLWTVPLAEYGLSHSNWVSAGGSARSGSIPGRVKPKMLTLLSSCVQLSMAGVR